MANMVKFTNFEHGEYAVSGMRDIRFVVMLTREEEKEIQTYRFSRQIGTKAEAMRELVRKGLAAETMKATTE